jgi:hypothetical protein
VHIELIERQETGDRRQETGDNVHHRQGTRVGGSSTHRACPRRTALVGRVAPDAELRHVLILCNAVDNSVLHVVWLAWIPVVVVNLGAIRPNLGAFSSLVISSDPTGTVAPLHASKRLQLLLAQLSDVIVACLTVDAGKVGVL